jgi:hypothetical protein
MTGNFHKDLALLIGFIVAYIILALVLTGCTVRKPGEAFPYTTSSYAEDDVIYNGVGISF